MSSEGYYHSNIVRQIREEQDMHTYTNIHVETWNVEIQFKSNVI